MPRSVDVVIVGGGIFGRAVAWNLARRPAGSVLLLERGGPFRPERFGSIDALSPNGLARCADARSKKSSG